VDPIILRFNIAILIFIILIPFTTDISGAYDGVLIAVLLFHANILIIGALFLGLWTYICRCSYLSGEIFDAAMAGERFWLLATVPSVAILGIAVSFFSPPYSLLTYLLVPILTAIRKRSLRNLEQKNV
jgi:uncharacterized membrane protein